MSIHVIGGGLAGSEAAWQAASRGVSVTLHEMRPLRPTAVHKTDHLAELVCSNSFRGDKIDNAVGLLKEEMRRLGSIVLRVADATRVPAGAALAVDRERFARGVTEALMAHPLVTIVRGEVERIPPPGSDRLPVVVATGPLTADALAGDLRSLVGSDALYFYDAVSPIVLAESIDLSKVFRASRWGRSLAARGASPSAFARRCIPPDGVAQRSNTGGILAFRALPAGRIVGLGATTDLHHGLLGPAGPVEVEGGRACGAEDEGDYLNCPLGPAEYDAFYDALLHAESATVHDLDREIFFEGCLPIEVMARRGRDTLRFGPMKPVGLVDPRTGKPSYAVVQLRQDDLAGGHFSLVGFQTQLKWGEQARVLRLIPGLERAEFVRFGVVHRNTYINAPTVLHETWQTRARPDVFIAGQVSGVEGYVESAASGLIAGLNAAALVLGEPPRVPPRTTAIGALGYYVSHANPAHYQPSNIAFGLLPPLARSPRKKALRKTAMAERALADLETWIAERSVGAAGVGA